jgi:hypothetical protein
LLICVLNLKNYLDGDRAATCLAVGNENSWSNYSEGEENIGWNE